MKPKFLVTQPPLKVITSESRHISVSGPDTGSVEPAVEDCEMECSGADNLLDSDLPAEEFLNLDENDFDSIR